MALSLDGTAGNIYGGGSTWLTGTLACSNAGNVICVVVLMNADTVASVVALSGGATFTRRATSGGSNPLELWTGYASGTFNSDIEITPTNHTITYGQARAFGVNGGPSSSYFDSNASLPNTGSTDPRTVSTTAANTFIIGAFRMTSTPAPTAGTGWTKIGADDYLNVEYKIVSAAQSSLSVTLGTGAGDANGAIADAIVQAGGAAPTYTLTGSPGSITYAGATATLSKTAAGYTLTASPGNITYQGATATLTWSGAPVAPAGGGLAFAQGGGGGRRLAREVSELEYIKEIEKRLKRGKALRAAIDELKVSPQPEVRREVQRIEDKALKRNPDSIRWIAEQLRQIEARNIIPPSAEEDFSPEIEALLVDERESVQQLISILEKSND